MTLIQEWIVITLLWTIRISTTVSVIKNIWKVRLSCSKYLSSIQRRWHRSFLIYCKSHVIILNSFCKVTSFILTCSSSICCVDMVWINIKYCCKVLNTCIDHFQFLICTSSHIVSTSILIIKLHQAITVVNRWLKQTFFKITWCSDEKCLPMVVVLF